MNCCYLATYAVTERLDTKGPKLQKKSKRKGSSYHHKRELYVCERKVGLVTEKTKVNYNISNMLEHKES